MIDDSNRLINLQAMIKLLVLQFFLIILITLITLITTITSTTPSEAVVVYKLNREK